MQVQNMESILKEAAILRKEIVHICFQNVEEYEFSPCEIDILIFLSNNQSINTNKELVSYLGVSKGLIARSVEALQKRNLIDVCDDKEDRRIQHFILSEKSKTLIDDMKKTYAIFAKRILEGISNEEQKTVQNVLEKIKHNVTCIKKGE